MARIIIKNQDGSIKQTKELINTDLILKGGKGINLTTSGNAITVIPSFSLNDLTTALNNNYKDIVDHTGNFSDPAGYYLSKINNTAPINNNFMLNGDLTSQLEPTEYGLTYSDFGRPDVDCGDYARLKELIDKLESYMDKVKDQIIQIPTIKDSESKAAKIYGVHAQYQALAKLWNYIVQVSTARLNVSYQNRSIFVQTSYLNHNNENAGKGTPVTCTITLKNYTGTDIPKLYARFARASFTSSKNNPNYPAYNPAYPEIQAELIPGDTVGHTWLFTFPNEIVQGDTITLLTRFDITTTDKSTDTKKDIYTLADKIQIARAVANMDITMPDTIIVDGKPEVNPDINKPYQTYDEHIMDYHKVGEPEDCNTQIISTANPTIYSKQEEYTADEFGTYVITIDNYVDDASINPISYKITKNAETWGVCQTTESGFIDLGICSIVFDSGCLHPGDQFAVSIVKKTVDNEGVPLIKDSNLMVEINWNNILFCSTNGNIQRNKTVNIIGEENDVGELTVSVSPTINTIDGGVTGGGAVGGSVSGGSVIMGTVSIGSVNVGTVSIGSVKQGSFYMGTVSIGSIYTGSISVGIIDIGTVVHGTISIGSIKQGTVSIGTFYAGSVSVGTVALGTISIGSVKTGTVSVGSIVVGTVSVGTFTQGSIYMGSVIGGNVSPVTVQMGTVSVGTINVGSVIMGTIQMGTIVQGSVSIGSIKLGSISIGSVIASNAICDSVTVNMGNIIYESTTYEVVPAVDISEEPET